MRREEHALFEQLAAGHALGALEPEDEGLFLLHLPACAACQRDLATHTDTAAALAGAAPAVDLPQGLADRLRAAVEAESPGAFAAPDPVPHGTAPEPPPAPVVPLASRRAAGTRPRALLAAAAAVAVLVTGLSGTALVLDREARTQLARGERLEDAVAALAEDGGVSVPLRTRDQQVAAVAQLHDGTVSLVVAGLETNAPGTSYVLWALSPYGGKSPVGVFDVRGDGVEVLRDLPLAASDVEGFAVTAEEGDAAPDSPGSVPLAVGTVDA